MKQKTEELPLTVERAVRAMCDDYDRRAAEIRRGKLSPAVLGHYMMLNGRIDEAIATCCEPGICEEMRRDIASGTGHRFTQLYYLAPKTYKARKRESKYAVARALGLI